MRTIHMFKGLPGSGKSTEALKMILKSKAPIKRINKDSIRLMLDGPTVNFHSEMLVVKIQDYAVETALVRGFDVILDDTNLANKYFLRACEIAKRVGDVQIVERYIDCPLATCLARNKERMNPVPEDLIERMHRKYIKGRTVETRTEYFPKTPRSFDRDPSLPDAIIVDIDGTLALNESGRSPFDMSRVADDSVNVPVAELVRTYHAKGVKVLNVSGRNEKGREDTELWLQVSDIPYDLLLMREDGDNRRDAIVKEEIYEKELKGNYNILWVVDDRPRICQMWRSKGITVLQVNNLDF